MPTNVLKVAYRIAKRDDAMVQFIYYDQGVGTGNLIDHIRAARSATDSKTTSTTPIAS